MHALTNVLLSIRDGSISVCLTYIVWSYIVSRQGTSICGRCLEQSRDNLLMVAASNKAILYMGSSPLRGGKMSILTLEKMWTAMISPIVLMSSLFVISHLYAQKAKFMSGML